MLDYAIKDGDVVAGGLDPDLGGEDVSGDGTVWHTIANAETVDRFWELVRELAPRALLCNHQSSERMRTGIIDPLLLHTGTHVSFESCLITCRSLTTGYVTTCLELVSLTPTGLHGPHPAAREPKRPRALTALWCAGSHPILGPPAVKR